MAPCPEIEQAAFALADGQVSDVIRSAGQYVVLKRDGLIAAREIKLEQVADRLSRIIRDQKMRQWSGDIFKDLQRTPRVQNVYNDARLRQQVGREVVALVNGEPIYLRQLDDECLSRHGAEVLQGLIGRRMLELACRQNQVDGFGERDRRRDRPHGRAVDAAPAGRLARRQELARPGDEQAGHLRGNVSPRDQSGRRWPCGSSPREGRCDRGRPQEGLRFELRSQGPLPGDRVEQSPPRPAGVGGRAQEPHGGELRRAGCQILHRAEQPRQRRPGRPHPPLRRPTGTGKGGIRPEAGRGRALCRA